MTFSRLFLKKSPNLFVETLFEGINLNQKDSDNERFSKPLKKSRIFSDKSFVETKNHSIFALAIIK